MLNRISRKLRSLALGDLRREILFNRKVSQGAASSVARIIDPTRPDTWEFSGFSQNGEDGIIDYLCRQLPQRNNYFIEIGASDGLENNTAWLATCSKFNGIMIEGNAQKLEIAKSLYHGHGVEYLNLFVTKENVGSLKEHALHTDLDFFTIDIDGMDYYLMSTIIDAGFTPKIVCVEYNSAFGPDRSVTIPYSANFVHDTSSQNGYVYYGVSLKGWKTYFARIGYRFITVDLNGVNAFFVRNDALPAGFLDAIQGQEFRENSYQLKMLRKSWHDQFELMKDRDFFAI